MSRDLPFDGDDVEVTDPSGDTAYRVANGVARVARAGAYVTGGALVASSGGAPAHPGEQRLDSWHTHWSGNNDPQPDLPSPVVTFPDPTPDSIPVAPSRPSLVSHDESGHLPPAPVAPPSPNETTLEIRVGAHPRDTVTAWDDAHVGAPSFLDSPSYDPERPWLGYDLDDQTEGLAPDGSAGGQPWFGYDPSAQTGAGGPSWAPGGHGGGYELPEAPAWMTPDKPSDLFAWAEHPAAERSEVGELAETVEDGTTPTGFGPGFQPWAPTHGVDGAQAAQLMDSFDDFGVYLGVDAHASLYTEFEIDFGIGPTGAWFNTEMRVEVEAGATVKTAAGSNIGDQLDNLSDWLDGKSTAAPAGRNAEQSGLGGSAPFGANAPGAPGALGPTGPAPAAPAPAAPQPAAFAAPPAPVAMAQAPVAPPPAPVLAAPVAAAPVVAATPLQTTIQPDAASTPVAHVFTPPPGPSPLTAPAATVPVLFDHHPPKYAPPTPPPPKPVDTTDQHTPPPVTKIPSTVLPTPGVTTPDSGSVSTPGSVITKTPTVDILPAPDTDVDVTTKVPTITTRPTQPSTPDDVTTPSTGGTTAGGGTTSNGGGVSGGGSTQPTRPSTDSPSVDVPSVSVPSQPSPTHSVPSVTVPSVDAPSVDVPAPTYSAPSPAPVTPLKPQVGTKPIADQWDSGHAHAVHQAALPIVLDDHALAVSGGLSSGLLPDGGLFDVHAVHGTLDHTLI